MRNYITKEKKKELEIELLDLKGPRRKEIISSLEYAKSLGDLSENAEYHQAREEQGKLEARIAQIEQILKTSEIVGAASGDTVEVGSYVSVRKEGGKEDKIYQVVGSLEADTLSGKISNSSPIGLALFGKKRGDKISFKTPAGAVLSYKITKVS